MNSLSEYVNSQNIPPRSLFDMINNPSKAKRISGPAGRNPKPKENEKKKPEPKEPKVSRARGGGGGSRAPRNTSGVQRQAQNPLPPLPFPASNTQANNSLNVYFMGDRAVLGGLNNNPNNPFPFNNMGQVNIPINAIPAMQPVNIPINVNPQPANVMAGNAAINRAGVPPPPAQFQPPAGPPPPRQNPDLIAWLASQ